MEDDKVIFILNWIDQSINRIEIPRTMVTQYRFQNISPGIYLNTKKKRILLFDEVDHTQAQVEEDYTYGEVGFRVLPDFAAPALNKYCSPPFTVSFSESKGPFIKVDAIDDKQVSVTALESPMESPMEPPKKKFDPRGMQEVCYTIISPIRERLMNTTNLCVFYSRQNSAILSSYDGCADWHAITKDMIKVASDTYADCAVAFPPNLNRLDALELENNQADYMHTLHVTNREREWRGIPKKNEPLIFKTSLFVPDSQDAIDVFPAGKGEYEEYYRQLYQRNVVKVYWIVLNVGLASDVFSPQNDPPKSVKNFGPCFFYPPDGFHYHVSLAHVVIFAPNLDVLDYS